MEETMSVFTLERREEIQEKLLKVGIELIKEKGIRKMTISQVTEKTGIGKGTFYHFYSAKEFYVWDVIRYSKNEIKSAMNEIIEREGGINRKSFKELINQFSFSNGANLIDYITVEDELWLKEKLPKEYILDIPKEDEIISSFLKCCKSVKKDVDGHVLANMIKIMALAVESKEMLYKDALQSNLDIMVQTMCEYVFEEE